MLKVLFILLIMLNIAVPSINAKTLKQFSNEIKSKTSNLHDIKENIKEKQRNKEQYLIEEKNIRNELRKVANGLKRVRKEGIKIKQEIKTAEKELKKASEELGLAGWEKKQWLEKMIGEINLFYRSNNSYYRIFGKPLQEKLRIQSIEQKKLYFNDAQAKEGKSKKALDKWKVAQRNLLQLKKKHEKTMKIQANIKEKKNKLLKTTIGRRIVEEEELKKLVASAGELQKLILKLGSEKKKTEKELLEGKNFANKKKLLPWPVEGEVTTKFGKSRHSELNSYVISNGIKIRTQPDAKICAVSKSEVIFSGEFRSYGQMIILDHGGGYFTLYGNVGEIFVREDQKIVEGEVVAAMPKTGPGNLYFEIRYEGKPQNPLDWLRSSLIYKKSD